MKNLFVTILIFSSILFGNEIIKSESNITKDILVIEKKDYSYIDTTPDFDGYVSIILINSNGKRSLLLPNKYTPDPYIQKGTYINELSTEYLKSKISVGLHYIMIVVSQQRLILGVTKKDNKSYSAFNDDKIFMKVLDDMKSGKYGKIILKILPIYK